MIMSSASKELQQMLPVAHSHYQQATFTRADAKSTCHIHDVLEADASHRSCPHSSNRQLHQRLQTSVRSGLEV